MSAFDQYDYDFNPRTPRGVRPDALSTLQAENEFQSTHPARGATDGGTCRHTPDRCYFNPRTPRGVRPIADYMGIPTGVISIHAPREGCDAEQPELMAAIKISIHAPREGCDSLFGISRNLRNIHFNPRTPRGVRRVPCFGAANPLDYFNPRTPRGVRQQTLPKSREFAWLNLLICTRGRRLSIQKQTRLCSIKLSFMLFGCEPAGEGVSSWTSHATKSKVRLEGRSAYSQSARSSAHSDFPGNKSGDCPVRGP